MGIAATARNNAPESAAARTNPIIALRDIEVAGLMNPSGAQGRERKQCDHARALDRDGQLTLMTRAIARGAGGNNLAALGYEALQCANVLVIDLQGFVGTEAANLATRTGTAPAHAAAAPFASAIVTASITAIATAARASIAAFTIAAMFTSFFVCHLSP